MCRGLVLAAVFAGVGCHSGKVFIAPAGDYADYRAVRVAEDVDERMARTWAYLKERPDGMYAGRLRRYFEKSEPVFFKMRSRSIRGLEAYLEALPDGPHADEALAMLMGRRDAKRRESADMREARLTGSRLDAEREKRDEAAKLLHWWLDAFLHTEVWSAPLSDAPKDLIVRYRLSLPQPKCTAAAEDATRQRCVKPLERSFRVPGSGQLEDRTLAFLLEVELDERWYVQRVTVSGAGILLATEEARRKKALEDDEASTRAAAAAFVARLTTSLFERNVTCNGGTEASGSTLLSCEGLLLTLVPGRDGGDDVLRIVREGGLDDEEEEGDTSSDDDDDDDNDDDEPSGDGAQGDVSSDGDAVQEDPYE